MSEQYEGRQFVGMDLHRRRSVLVRTTESGEALETVRVVNDRDALAAVMARAGVDPEVVLEATYGWYWVADALAESGACVHLAHPLGVKGFAYRRVKNDERDARDLADLLRMGRLPQAWIAPPEIRELRDLVRHRARMVHLRSSLRCQIHAVLANQGVTVSMSFFTKMTSGHLTKHPGFVAVQTLPGIGPVLGAVFVAEIGDVTRFRGPTQLASWAGLTPKHHESDTTVRRGRITKQGSRLVRWAGPRSKPCNAPASTPVSVPTGSGRASAAAATSPPWPPPASWSSWCSSRCAMARCAASPQRHEPSLPRPGAGRGKSDPRHPGEAAAT